MNSLNKSLFLFAISFVLVVGCNTSGDGGRSVSVSPNVPSDIPGGAPNADLQEAAVFAWQEFIALNWPAESGTRDTPDTTKLFGNSSFDEPLVWQTYRHKVEIYPGTGNPPGFDANSPDFGYDTVPPQYIYSEGEIDPCEGQTPVETPAWINLDEISQIGLASMFAGKAPGEVNTNPQLFRFLAKANKEQYVYVVDPILSLWDHTSAPSDEPYWDMVDNLTAVAQGNGNPSKLPGPVIDFPDGMIEVKTAFRELTEEERNSGRWYTTTVRYYEQDEEDPNKACYREAVWGLAALHIIHKTPTAPYFIFATFEQADNLLTQDGKPVENEDGDIINPPMTSSSTTPALTYMDGNPPTLNIVGNQFCTDTEIGDRLYYLEEPLGGLPDAGNICQNERDRSIPPIVVSVNQDTHNAIMQYNNENGLETSPWLFYKLVNVQWRPFDVTEINNSNPNNDNNDATFYLNNIVVETDFTLQSFSGRLYFDTTEGSGLPTDLPANFNNFDPSRQTFQSILTFDDSGNLVKTFNMGGCMGCHGNAQLSGSDFSFILGGGRVKVPEAPGVTLPGTSNPPLALE